MRAMKKLQTVSEMWARLFYGGQRDAQAAFDYDEAVCQSAVEWLESSPPEPFCLFMPLIWPHCPFEAEEPYFSMYDRSKMPAPVSVSAKTGYEPRYMGAIRERYGLGRVGPAEWAEIVATYYGMITRLDDQFGRIMDVVHAKGFWDTSTTMFFTDHGEYLGDYGLIEKWPAGLSNSLTQNPLIIGVFHVQFLLAVEAWVRQTANNRGCQAAAVSPVVVALIK